MLVQEDRGGSVRTYAHDEMGNTSYLLDNSSVTDSYEYTPYGQVSHTGSAVTPFTFIGALGYFATGWSFLSSYVRARWYSNVSGQWGSADPFWPWQKAYQYVDGNPVTWADPQGLNPFAGAAIGFGVGCASGAAVTFLGNYFNGNSDPNIQCKIGFACLANGIAGLAAGITVTTLGAAAILGCIMGAIAAIISTLGNRICDCPGSGLRPEDVCGAIGNAIGGCVTGFLVGHVGGLPIKGTTSGPTLKGGPSWQQPKPPLFDPISTIIAGLVSFIGDRFGVACAVSPQVFG